jgi:hypothetical protein
VPLGAIVALLVTLFLKLKYTKESTDRSEHSVKKILCKLDLGGSILFIASICFLFLALQWGGQSLPWASVKIIALFTAFALLLAVFLFVEWRMGNDAAVPFSVLRQRSMAFGAVYLFFFSMPNFSVRATRSYKFLLTLAVWGLLADILPGSEAIQRTEKRS